MSLEPSKNPVAEVLCEECDAIATERNLYFTGKYMAKRDFADEQQYFLSRHRLHNRLLHGWGVVCGLRVIRHTREDCRNRWIIIRAGIAFDCCGRELIVEKDLVVELPLPRFDNSGKRLDPREGETEYDQPFLVCLKYREEAIELVPALYAEGACDPARKQANRVREGVKPTFVLVSEAEPGCWASDDKAPCGSHKDCDDSPEGYDGRGGGCVEPLCPCACRVPIALVTPLNYGRQFELKIEGRPKLPVAPNNLTHIVDINWPHGGTVSVSGLRDEEDEGGMGGKLKISFDRKLKTGNVEEPDGHGEHGPGGKRREPGNGIGINVHTFVVQFGNIQRTLQFLPSAEDPSVSEDGCSAIYLIDDDYLGLRKHRDDLADNVIYITLKCDFVLDCLDNPVDGTHLGGQRPTGSGSPGGDFCSWFTVVADGHSRPGYQGRSD